MKHILLNEAHAIKYSSIAPPTEFQYDQLNGYWMNDNGMLLMNDRRFPAVGTKKFDVETGEDHKGK